MCNFLSAIITKNEVFYDFDNDGHEALIEKHKLNDRKLPPDFVRVEYVAICPCDSCLGIGRK